MKKENGTQKQTKESQDMAAYLFHQGTNFLAYEYLGQHFVGECVVFRVWAPNAESVSVCGDFNGWNTGADFMTRITEGGVWELSLPRDRVHAGQCYKYCIKCKDGTQHLKADPYARYAQLPPETASVTSPFPITGIDTASFT